MKRTFDVVLAAAGLLVLAPLLLAIALAIRLDSPGGAIYRQVRVGRGGRPFEICKFRTMHTGSDRVAANISPTGDPRVTRVGRVLRRTYLDELPQLLNVLRGDMSLLGPRPETPEFVAFYRPEERRLLSIRPGVMGPSTLLGMTEEDRLADSQDAVGLYTSTILHERLAADLTYLEHWSLRRDVRLLLTQIALIIRRLW